MNNHPVLEARLDMLTLAVECIAASLPAAQAREVTKSFGERLSAQLAEKTQFSADVDAAVAAQVGRLIQALQR